MKKGGRPRGTSLAPPSMLEIMLSHLGALTARTRKVTRMSKYALARHCLTSRDTVEAIEMGDPAVPFYVYIRAILTLRIFRFAAAHVIECSKWLDRDAGLHKNGITRRGPLHGASAADGCTAHGRRPLLLRSGACHVLRVALAAARRPLRNWRWQQQIERRGGAAGRLIATRHAQFEAEVAAGIRDARSLIAIPAGWAKAATLTFPKNAFGGPKPW